MDSQALPTQHRTQHRVNARVTFTSTLADPPLKDTALRLISIHELSANSQTLEHGPIDMKLGGGGGGLLTSASSLL